MFYKILEKYSQIKIDYNSKQELENKRLLGIEQDIIKDFLDLYDKDIKKIHHNEELIEKDLQILHKENEKFQNISNQTIQLYDGFLEYLKEAGDLYNWCTLIEKDMNIIHDTIAMKFLAKEKPDNNKEQTLDQ